MLSHYAALGLLFAACYVFGRRLTGRLRYDSMWEEVAVSTALGIGVVAYLTLFLSLAGLLYAGWTLTLLALGFVACYGTWADIYRRTVAGWKITPAAAYATAGLLICLPVLLLPLYPPTTWDATEYHLAAAKIYVQNHGLVFTPYLRFPVFAQTNQMLFTLALLVYDDVFAQLIEFLLLLTLAAALVGFGRRMLSPRAGWWAAALLLGSPLVVRIGTVAYVDIGLALFTTLAVYAVYVWRESRVTGWLALAAIFCGLAIGIKYPALLLLLMLTGVVGYVSWKDGDYRKPVWFSALAVFVALPWLARNYYYMRNPLFPFFPNLFAGLFGYGAWGPEQYRGMFEDFATYGLGRSFPALLWLPWNLAAHWERFGEGRLSPVYFFVPHLLFVAGVARRKIGFVLALGTAYLLFWFFTAQVSRYLMPALPLLALATAAALDGAIDRLSGRLPAIKRWSARGVITAGAALLFILPSWAWAVLRLREYGPVPVTAEHRQAYLAQRLPSYPAYQFLNNRHGQGYTVYALMDENMAYFADGQFMGDHFGVARYSRIIDRLADGEALYEELHRLGASHLLVREDRAAADFATGFTTGFGGRESFQSRFTLVYSSPGLSVYELRPRTSAAWGGSGDGSKIIADGMDD